MTYDTDPEGRRQRQPQPQPQPARESQDSSPPARPIPGETATRAVYVISVAAELAGVHPQTLRVYERRGLVDPSRTGGGNRRYSQRDIEQLRRIGDLTAAGLNLEGVRRVLELEADVARLQAEVDRVRAEANDAVEKTHRHYRRDLVPVRQAIVVSRSSAAARDRAARDRASRDRTNERTDNDRAAGPRAAVGDGVRDIRDRRSY